MWGGVCAPHQCTLEAEACHRFMHADVCFIDTVIAFFRYAWSNASYGSELCLMYTPDILGCAFLYGAAKDKEVAMQDPPDKRWWDVCLPPKNQITETALVDIMQQFFDFCKLREEFLDIQLPCDPQLYAAADHASKKRRV